MTAGNVTLGTRLVSCDGAIGTVIDIVRLDIDPHHVGIRIATDDGVTGALFHIDDIVTVLA